MIDNETVKKIALLSRLRIEDDKLDEFRGEFNKIFAWIEQLKEVDTDKVEPLTSVNESKLSVREDKVDDGNLKEEVLLNAPSKEFGYFVVPKVVE